MQTGVAIRIPKKKNALVRQKEGDKWISATFTSWTIWAEPSAQIEA
jgi:hypothetical protein